MTPRARARLILIVLSTTLTLLVAEVGLRVVGRGPCAPFEALAQAPVMTAPDSEIGWVNAPGTYHYRPSGAQGPEIAVTIDETGRRAGSSTGDDPAIALDDDPAIALPADRSIALPADRSIALDDDPAIALYGGSFTFGFGVDDRDTVAAQLAVALPAAHVQNAAVPGYGTLQSRKLYARHRAAGNPAPDVVVYGLVEFHDSRNAAARSWLHTLGRAGAHHPWIGVPSVQWDGRTLQEYPARHYTHWAASELSAVVNLVELAAINLQDRWLNTKTETTIQTIVAWRDEVAPARFVVALMHAPTRHRAYVQRLAEEGVQVVDLREHGYPEHAVPIDGHPDALVHLNWARTLAKALR